jgi:hypothetical protein
MWGRVGTGKRQSERFDAGDARLHVGASSLAQAADAQYYRAKSHADVGLYAYGHAWALATAGWRALVGDFNYDRAFQSARNSVEKRYTHSTEYATRQQATDMRAISDELLNKLMATGKFTREELDNPPMRSRCNDKLWVLDAAQADVSRVTPDDVAPLFDPRNRAGWPNIILTANHARASSTDDLVELLKGVEQLAGDAGGKPLGVYRLQHGESAPQVTGKTITVLACHTERDIFLNGAELIDRRCALAEDAAGNADPAKRTLAHMSPAAMRLAKLMLKAMVEPAKANGTALIDLDQATRERRDAGNPFIADAHRKDVVLRADANAIAQHFKLVGYSKGANAVTDALRFFYLECAHLGERLKIRGKDGKLHAATEKDIKTLIENIGLLSLAPGEVPLTGPEKHNVGMKRTTILNTHDMTAGHLVNPDAADYDVWSDKLVTIEGTREELGHSIRAALGGGGVPGFIMNPANTAKPNYQTAQDDVTAFFASNHHRHAITTLCLSPEGSENVMYVQFAPGASRAEERAIGEHIAEVFKNYGFSGVKVESDLANRRRLRVVLDEDAQKHPLIGNDAATNRVAAVDHGRINACARAIAALKEREDTGLFITHEAVDYLTNLLEMPDKIVGDMQHRGVAARVVAGAQPSHR